MPDQLIYAPGDPKTTQYVMLLMMASGLIEHSTNYYVTSTHWGAIIAELNAQYRDRLMDPTKPAPWDLNGNKAMKFGKDDPCLTVINSGTEDQEVCNLLNDEPARVARWGARRDASLNNVKNSV